MVNWIFKIGYLRIFIKPVRFGRGPGNVSFKNVFCKIVDLMGFKKIYSRKSDYD